LTTLFIVYKKQKEKLQTVQKNDWFSWMKESLSICL